MIWDKVAKNLRIMYAGTVLVIWASAIPKSLLSPPSLTHILWHLLKDINSDTDYSKPLLPKQIGDPYYCNNWAPTPGGGQPLAKRRCTYLS